MCSVQGENISVIFGWLLLMFVNWSSVDWSGFKKLYPSLSLFSPCGLLVYWLSRPKLAYTNSLTSSISHYLQLNIIVLFRKRSQPLQQWLTQWTWMWVLVWHLIVPVVLLLVQVIQMIHHVHHPVLMTTAVRSRSLPTKKRKGALCLQVLGFFWWTLV